MFRFLFRSPNPAPTEGGGAQGAGDGGAGHAGAGGEGSPAPAPVPYERFQQVVGERNKYKTDLDAISAQHKAASESNAGLQKALEAERLANLRTRTAVQAGLPLEFAERLQGSTAEELTADAAQLVPLLRPATPGVPPPPGGGTPARIDLSNMTPAQVRERKADVLRQARGG